MGEEVEKLTGELLREIAAAEIILERPWPNLRRVEAELSLAFQRLQGERVVQWGEASFTADEAVAALDGLRNRAKAAETQAEALGTLLRQAFDSRAPDYAEQAHPGWYERAKDALASSTLEREQVQELHELGSSRDHAPATRSALDLALNGCKAAWPILTQLRDRQYNVESWGLEGRIKAVEAALNATAKAEESAGQLAWRPIETAPKLELIVVTNGEEAAVSAHEPTDWGEHYWALEGDGGLDWEPTHWMPLPGPAEARSEQVGWRPIETAPKDGTQFLARSDDGAVYVCFRHNPSSRTDEILTSPGRWNFRPAKVWMPLPTPPKAEADHG